MIVYESSITTIPSQECVIIEIPINNLGTGTEFFYPTGRYSYTNNPLDENDNTGYNLIFDESENDKIRAEMYNDGISNIIITITNLKQFDIECKIFLIHFDNIN